MFFYNSPHLVIVVMNYFYNIWDMRKFITIAGILILVVLIGAVAVAMYVKIALPDVGPAENIVIKRTPERIARGKYIANSVAVCMDCHSQRDWSIYAGPLKKETFAAGGEKFGQEIGFPGTIYTKNITPYALRSWTDGEIFRAITKGVSKDGSALFPLMPYHNYGRLDKEDIMSVIAYLRTLPSVKNEVPEHELDFPLNFIINTMPVKDSLVVRPDSADQVQYGKYLVTAASCVNCHSKEEKGALVPGSEFGGGREFKSPGAGSAFSVNISPDNQTGIGTWNREVFIKRFKMYTDSNYVPTKLLPGEVNTPMPWAMYATMTENDLGAIYSYLRTVKPVSNKVIAFQKSLVKQ